MITSFANIASSNTGTVPRTRPGQVMTAGAWHGAPPPALSVSGPPPQGGPGSDRGEHDGRQGGGLGVQDQQRGRSVSPKRAREDGDEAGNGGNGRYQTVNRKPRKVTYGKSKVTMDGAEAAPIEIFIGNTNPRATPEIITDVMKKCAEDLPEKIALEVVEVKCLNNLEVDPNPRTRCWKITVPYKYKELMVRDELYPTGWSHRQFYSARPNKAKRQKSGSDIDPVARYLPDGATGSGSNST